MKKILVVETGGTFATCSNSKVRSLSGEDSKKIYDFDIVKDRLKGYELVLDRERPIYTLSENMTLENLNILLEYLENKDFKEYDGVIITHGTDTLSFTSNLLSLTISDKKVPIVIVSSNHPLTNPKANGVDNFVAAIDFIENVKATGVFVVYKNFNGIMEVHLGSRVKQMNQVIDAYESFKNVRFGIMESRSFYINTSKYSPSLEEVTKNENTKDIKVNLNKNVILIHPYTGLRYDYFQIDENIDAICCGVYHSGTVNSQDINIDQSINTLIKRCEKYNIPLFIGELTSGVEVYESIEKIKESSIVYPVYDISLENLYMKIHTGLSITKNNDELYDFINNKNIFFEKIVERH
ncbi:asparaginase domain-containing protein [Citroniella saccharovorans]|uniref:Asparaginase domain-containing protein n=1 Tax=Citroniella saccharovorans TaxID=2053367 RepID=A0AAW9N053_9FIRM|nr:asparaginase domain-containing protein [Citroniella saccharovorans]MEB3430177.1 asparaginase domain-containing protein [Citroniella saccharovorans]